MLSVVLFDDGELRHQVDERRKRGGSAESIRRGHRVVNYADRRIGRHRPHAGPHFRRLSWVFRRRGVSDAAPPHGEVDRSATDRQMGRHDGRVFNLARTAINRRHTETDALTPLEATGENAMGRQSGWVIEAREISPNDKLARGVSGLRRRRSRGLASPASLPLSGRWGLPGNRGPDGDRHEPDKRYDPHGLEQRCHSDRMLQDFAHLF